MFALYLSIPLNINKLILKELLFFVSCSPAVKVRKTLDILTVVIVHVQERRDTIVPLVRYG